MAAVLVPAVIFVSGCGGGSGEHNTSGAAATATSAGQSPAATTATAPSVPAASAPATSTSAPTGTSAKSSAQPAAIAGADAICARRNKELASVSGAGSSLQAVASAASRRAAIEQRALGELEQLTPPSEVAGDYRAVLAFSKSVLERTTKVEAYARSNDAAGVSSARASDKGWLRLLFSAARAGLRDCSVPPAQ